MFTQYNHETGKTTLTKLAKGGIITVAAVASLGIFRLTAVKRIPAIGRYSFKRLDWYP